jgi:hypothetical protein
MSRYDKMIELEESAEHEERMRVIAQNGNSGLNYETNTSTNGFDVVFEEVKAPTKAEKRKAIPVYSGFVQYFPNAIKEVAECSLKANIQHNGDEPLHWAMEKSKDELDALMRHLIDHASGEEWDDDSIRHLTKVCWRSLAMLERTLTNKF